MRVLIALALLAAFAWPDGIVLAQVGAGVSDPTARMPSQMPGGAPAASAPKPKDLPLPEIAEDAPQRQKKLSEALVLSRLGRHGEARKIYSQLVSDYPDDKEILFALCEHLVDQHELDSALVWMEKAGQPDSRLIRLKARIYMEARKPRLALPVLKSLSDASPNDAALHIDLASAYADSGDPILAIKEAKRAVSLEPDNREFVRYAQEIEKSHRPRVSTSYQRYTQGQGTLISTASTEGQTPLGGRFSLKVGYNRIFVGKNNYGQSATPVIVTDNVSQTQTFTETVTETDPDTGQTTTVTQTGQFTDVTQVQRLAGITIQGGSPPIAVNMDYLRSSVLWQGPGGWELEGGVGYFNSGGGQFGQFAAVRYSPWAGSRFTVQAERNTPWYDPPEAAPRQGSYDTAKIGLDTTFKDRWGVVLEFQGTQYKLYDGVPYANRLAMTASISRKIFSIPNTWLAYTFAPAKAQYLTQPLSTQVSADTIVVGTRPVSLQQDEAIHQLSINSVWQPRNWIQLGFYGGVGRDLYRPQPFYFLAPTLVIRPCENIEWETRGEYRSETRLIRDDAPSTLVYTGLKVTM
jgi:tetratricopeptide (TPR) repeat protein